VKRSELRSHIIKTASELFYRNGYNSTGINEVIQKSGIAKATLYNHFKSKEELCLAYLKYMNKNFIENLKDYCYSKSLVRNRILSIFDFLEDFFEDKSFNGCWCIKTISELPKNDKNIRKEIQNQKSQFIGLITDLAEGQFEKKSSKYRKSKIRQIYLLYESAVGESHLHQEKWPIKEAREICAQII